jgi:mannosyltransferase
VTAAAETTPRRPIPRAMSRIGAGSARVDRAVVVVATALLAGMSLYRIGSKQLWIDESVAVGLTDVSFGRFVFVITHWEVNQAPFYVAFAGWHLLGDDTGTMRVLPALFAVATVPVVYLLGRRLYDSRIGALASVLFAVNALVLQWSQQIRGYTMALFLVTVATLLLVRLVDEPSTWRGLLYAGVAVLAVATHFFSGMVILAHVLSLLTLRPRPTRALVVAGATIGVLSVPFIWFAATAEGDPLGWVPESTPTSTLRLLARLSGGSFAMLAVGMIGIVGLGAIVRVVRRSSRSTESWRQALPLYWIAVPLILSIGFSLVVQPIAVPRFLIVIVPGIALVVAVGVANIPFRWFRILALVVLIAAGLYGGSGWYRADSREDWTAATSIVLAGLQPGDTVLVEPQVGSAAARYYARQLGDRELPIVYPDTSGGPIGDRLWELRRGDEVRGWLARSGIEPWRDRNYELVETTELKGVTVRLYERRPEAP